MLKKARDLYEQVKKGEHILYPRSRMDEKISAWQAQGIISLAAADELRLKVARVDVHSPIAHFGVHVFISIPLRFPLGSIARFSWTSTFRFKAWRKRYEEPEAYERARRTHTLVAIVIAPVPLVGGAAYLCTRQLWREGPLFVGMLLDMLSGNVPSRSYVALQLLTGRWYPFLKLIT